MIINPKNNSFPGKGVRVGGDWKVSKVVFEEVIFDVTREGSFFKIGFVQDFCNGIFRHFLAIPRQLP
jgi:hypothetical protein